MLKQRSKPAWWPGMAPLAGIVAGCLRREPNRPEQLEKGCVFLLPGIEGTAWQLRGTVLGLREGGVDRGLEIIAWGSHPFGQLYNLCAIRANRVRAGRIAARIADYQSAHPGAPVTLVGYSGGGGLAVLTAEALPDGVKLDRLILISAAVSPDYDLSGVLARADGVLNYYSPRDWLILGLGTRVFGTIDRRRTPSAGRIGFRDASGGLLETPGLTQIAWRPEWQDLGHVGGHVGWLSRAWAREVLAKAIGHS